MPENNQPPASDRPTLVQMVVSVLCAAFGVSSERYRKRDFERGSPIKFAVLGIVGTLLFIYTVFQVVQLVIRNATGS